jgi:RimJ/RimL family protein N-acetyltransferase
MQWQAQGRRSVLPPCAADGAVVWPDALLPHRALALARPYRAAPDGCEIEHTWIAPQAIRSAVNTEAKLLMLAHAFDEWGVHRVCFHTDARNERSRDALLRIGARFEGVLRAHRLSADAKPRDSARYSIIASEWPQVRAHLQDKLAARQQA